MEADALFNIYPSVRSEIPSASEVSIICSISVLNCLYSIILKIIKMILNRNTIALILSLIRHRIRNYWNKTSETLTVNTNYGPISGVKRHSCLNTTYYSFEKIPYAQPPINELRFADPVPIKPWENPLDCRNEPEYALQVDIVVDHLIGSEDCLYLNVYTKNVTSDSCLPVMVWIHGGGFVSGSASKDVYGPDYFLDKDVVFVSIQYRLGPLGFVSFKDPAVKVPGNAGLKDQTLALKWIKENIKNFGGDPENITLFGESAGGVSCSYHTISENSKRLFNKAIPMSGTALTHWAIYDTYEMTYRLAKQLGYSGPSDNDAQILKFLRSSSAANLAYGQNKILTDVDKRRKELFSFGPCIEAYVSEQCMIPNEPHLMMREAWGNTIPILLGGTSSEGLFSYKEAKNNPKVITELEDFQYIVPKKISSDPNSEISRNLGRRLKKIHTEGKEFTDDIDRYTDLIKFRSFWHAIHRTLLSRQKYAKAETFLYRFDYDSPENNIIRNILCGRNIRGVCHGDDLGFMFYNGLATLPNADSKEFETIHKFVNILTNFAKTGNPNIDDITPDVWKPIESDEKIFKCLNISSELSLIDLPETKKLATWDSLYPQDLLI